MQNTKSYKAGVSLLLLVKLFTCNSSYAQSASDRSWSVYKGNEGSTNYSPLSQITPENVGRL